MSVEPVRKSVTVSRSAVDCFRIFTEEIGQWWPLSTHSIAGKDSAGSCFCECRKGGAFYEVDKAGKRIDWGRIQVWDPPSRLIYSWHLSRPPETASEVEVLFTPLGTASTRIDIEHRNWERYAGADAQAMRDNYNAGWDIVFGQAYVEYLTVNSARP